MKTRAGLTVDRITQAAAALADEVGFEAVTLSALARSFGVKDASLYSHVKNLQDVRASARHRHVLAQDRRGGALGAPAVAPHQGFPGPVTGGATGRDAPCRAGPAARHSPHFM